MTRVELKTWRRRTERANIRGYFTEAELNLAGEWNRCAVGESHRRFPKIVLITKFSFDDPSCIEPKDARLRQLGIRFDRVVSSCAYNAWLGLGRVEKPRAVLDAFLILDLIEARLVELGA